MIDHCIDRNIKQYVLCYVLLSSASRRSGELRANPREVQPVHLGAMVLRGRAEIILGDGRKKRDRNSGAQRACGAIL